MRIKITIFPPYLVCGKVKSQNKNEKTDKIRNIKLNCEKFLFKFLFLKQTKKTYNQYKDYYYKSFKIFIFY